MSNAHAKPLERKTGLGATGLFGVESLVTKRHDR